MKKSKTIQLCLLLVSILMLTSVSVQASLQDVVVQLQIDNPIMQVNGTATEIDDGMGTKPVILNDRTLVPIRAIIEAFSGTVAWNGETQTVILNMDDDEIRLQIDSNVAYLNNQQHFLDTAPTVINERTMLPIRFIAEGFNLGVAWDTNTRTVYVIRDTFNDLEYARLMKILPDYSGLPYVTLNNNNPFFKEYEKIPASFEYYSELDSIGRCNVCISSVSEDTMPTETRGDISSVIPTGWVNKKYGNIDGGYLYNRCHLIGFQLTGENANERNLITGTRYLNVEGMLPFENAIDGYIERTGNHVMYRVTPVFKGDNLVADGVLMEAYSIEDNGAGVLLCVYCYNVQPGVYIDYLTGESNQTDTSQSVVFEQAADIIYRTPSGKKYHLDAKCGGKNSYQVTLKDAVDAGLTPCKKCVK